MEAHVRLAIAKARLRRATAPDEKPVSQTLSRNPSGSARSRGDHPLPSLLSHPEAAKRPERPPEETPHKDTELSATRHSASGSTGAGNERPTSRGPTATTEGTQPALRTPPSNPSLQKRTPKEKHFKRGELDDKAYELLSIEPGMSNQVIADRLGCHVKTLSHPRMIRFLALREELKHGKEQYRDLIRSGKKPARRPESEDEWLS
jgi:hypothetical protein